MSDAVERLTIVPARIKSACERKLFILGELLLAVFPGNSLDGLRRLARNMVGAAEFRGELRVSHVVCDSGFAHHGERFARAGYAVHKNGAIDPLQA